MISTTIDLDVQILHLQLAKKHGEKSKKNTFNIAKLRIHVPNFPFTFSEQPNKVTKTFSHSEGNTY